MRILALDCATTIGWAFGKAGEIPTFGENRMAPPGASHPLIFGKTLEWATDMIRVMQPDLVTYEAALGALHTGKSNHDTLLVLVGIPSVIQGVANLLGVPIVFRNLATIRSHFIGVTRGGRPELKRMTMKRCHMLGYHVMTDNEADACALWDLESQLKGRAAR